MSSIPSVLDYDTDTLRRELTVRGEPPGPITKTTKRVYLRQLKRLKKTGIVLDKSNQKQNAKGKFCFISKKIVSEIKIAAFGCQKKTFLKCHGGSKLWCVSKFFFGN